MNINKEYKVLQPKYYSNFKCDPNKCYENCCERWKIIIDKDTYIKYIQSENDIIKKIVKTDLSLNEKSINDDDYAVINLDKEMNCPFLNKYNLCEIFINMGEDSLSKTCKSFPRAITLINNVIERGLETSCSVASELALLNEKGIEFEQIKDTINFNDLYVNTPSIEELDQIQIIHEIRMKVINILQTRAFKLNDRLAIVGCFLSHIIDNIDISDHNYEEKLMIIKKFKIFNNLEEFKHTKNNYPIQNSQEFHHLNTILSMKFEKGDSIRFFSKRYIECLMQVLDAFGNVKDKELENYYNKNHEKYLKPYLKEKSYLLENFLVNYVFIYGLELFKLNDIWNSYLKLCIIYGLIKFNLVGLATYHKGMNDELTLKLIQSLSKTIIPDKTYSEHVIKYLEKNQLIELINVISIIGYR